MALAPPGRSRSGGGDFDFMHRRRNMGSLFFPVDTQAAARSVLAFWLFAGRKFPAAASLDITERSVFPLGLPDIKASSSSVPLTFAVTSAGTTGTSAYSTVSLAFAVTAAGVVGTSAASTVSESFAVTTAGNVATSAGATVSETFAVTATGQVATSAGVSVSETATITSAGQVQASTGSSPSLTVTITAAGATNLSKGATVPLAFAVAATGSVGVNAVTGDASIGFVALLTAAGTVYVPTYYFSAPAQSFKRGRRYGTQDSWWLSQNVGVTVWRKDGVWHSQISPPPWVTEGADRLYVGGRTYPLTDTERTDLVAAGYGDGIYSQ